MIQIDQMEKSTLNMQASQKIKEALTFKFCILAAGKGTRNTSIDGLHKSLLPVSNKATISKILEPIPKNIPVVIAVGYKSDQVVSYCDTVHSDRNIEYVHIDNFDRKGSGPGLSLLQCKDKLNCPFVFTSADTIFVGGWEQNFISADVNWVGVSAVNTKESHKYCLVKKSNDNIEFFYQKNAEGAKVFTGIAGVRDYDDFWKSLSKKDLIKGEHQVINGLKGLKAVCQKDMVWFDTGNIEAYIETKRKFPNDIVIEKNNETIFIDNGWVIKYFSNKKKLDNRVKRCSQLSVYSPSVRKINDNMMVYQYIVGERLSDVYDVEILSSFLSDYYDNFFKAANVYDSKQFQSNCEKMYRSKTYERIESFVATPIDDIQKINGVRVQSIKKILEKIDWNMFSEFSIPTRFHGDMQPENIIYSPKSKRQFHYIDWRETFGDSVAVGDMYYDLGKLYHALVISNSLVLEGKYSVEIDHEDSSAMLSYEIKNNLLDLENIFLKFCQNNSIDFMHVRLIGILNYLNIACLYDKFERGSYSRFLFLLGKKMLSQWFEEIENETPKKSN
jgi:choline kinase/thiamine kinase-like enzyme